MTEHRIALIADAGTYVGPALARSLAGRAHHLVLGDPDDDLVAELSAGGAEIEVVTGVRDLTRPEASGQLVEAALGRFGRLDSAAVFSGRVTTGPFLESTVDDLRTTLRPATWRPRSPPTACR